MLKNQAGIPGMWQEIPVSETDESRITLVEAWVDPGAILLPLPQEGIAGGCSRESNCSWSLNNMGLNCMDPFNYMWLFFFH